MITVAHTVNIGELSKCSGSRRQTIVICRNLPNAIDVIQVLEVDRFNTLLGEDFPLLLAADQDGDVEITNKGVLRSQ
jgi:hypothetical protein